MQNHFVHYATEKPFLNLVNQFPEQSHVEHQILQISVRNSEISIYSINYLHLLVIFT